MSSNSPSQYEIRLPNPKAHPQILHEVPKPSLPLNKNPLRVIKRNLLHENAHADIGNSEEPKLPEEISSNYDILAINKSCLGRYGSSYRVKHKVSRRSYLIKTMNKANCSEVELKNIYRTLDVLNKCKDENIGWVHHYSTIGNQIYIFFEPLNQIKIQKGETKANLQLFLNICRAAAFMQNHRLLNCCINTSNFCNARGSENPKLISFNHCNSQYCDRCNNTDLAHNFNMRQLGITLCELLGGVIKVLLLFNHRMGRLMGI